MREIKFRVYDKIGEKTWHVNSIEFASSPDFIANHGLEPKWLARCHDADGNRFICTSVDAILMQYTGLKDKNSVEIYEGDVVRGCQTLPYGNGTREYNPVAVKWGNNRDSDIGNDTTGFNIGSDVDWEVIGNIYENPKLLKEQN